MATEEKQLGTVIKLMNGSLRSALKHAPEATFADLEATVQRITGGYTSGSISYGAAIIDAETDCRLCQSARSKTGVTEDGDIIKIGYSKVKLCGFNVSAHLVTKVYAELLPVYQAHQNPFERKLHVQAAAKKLEATWLDPSKKLEASHLCHTANCVNPAHLVMESGFYNSSRLCRYKVTCYTHLEPQLVSSCYHSPPCVLRTPPPEIKAFFEGLGHGEQGTQGPTQEQLSQLAAEAGDEGVTIAIAATPEDDIV